MAAALSLVGLKVYRGITLFRQADRLLQLLVFIVNSLGVTWIFAMATMLLFTGSIDLFEKALRAGFTTSAILSVQCYLTLVGMYTTLQSLPIDPRLAVIGLAVSLFATLLLGTIPQGPARYRDRSRLYNQAVAQKLKDDGGEKFEGNVVGTGQSILGRIFSIHMFKVVYSILPRDQVDLHELPVLPGSMQAEATTRHANESDERSQDGFKMSSARLLWSTLMTQRAVLLGSEFSRLGAALGLVAYLGSDRLHRGGASSGLSSVLLLGAYPRGA